MKAYGKNLRISQKKLRVVAEVVRGNDAEEALKFLKFAPKNEQIYYIKFYLLQLLTL
jgi:ribosomal protein L22